LELRGRFGESWSFTQKKQAILGFRVGIPQETATAKPGTGGKV